MIEATTHLYEILLRFDRNGFVAAHAVDMTRLHEGDETRAETPEPARPVTESEMKSLIGAKNASMIVALDDARAAAAAATSRAEEAERRLAEIMDRAAALSAALTAPA